MSVRPPGSKWAFAGCAATNCAANTTWWMQPLLIGYWVASGRMGESATGLVVAVEMGSMALTGIALTRLLSGGRLVSWALGGLALAVFFSVLSTRVESFAALALTRGLVGAGTGTVMMISLMAIGRLAEADKMFARVNLVNLAFGVVVVGSMQHLEKIWPGITPLTAMAGILAILAIPTAFIPRDQRIVPIATDRASHAGPANGHSGRSLQIWLLAFIALGLGTVGGTAWSFFGVIAAGAGMTSPEIDSAIATAVLVAIVITVIAVLLGTRIGRLWPQLIAVGAMTANIILLSSAPGPAEVRLAACLNLGGLYFALPYLFGAGAAQDAHGQGSAYVGSAFALTASASPFLGGILLEYFGVVSLAKFSCVIAILVVAGLFFFEYLSRPERPMVGND